MATKTMIRDMLMHLSTVWTSRTITDDLVETYWMSLKRYSDEEIRKAGFNYLEQAQGKSPFPKPGDIIARIHREDGSQGSGYRLFDTAKCTGCGHYGNAIEEPKGSGDILCRECYSGLSQDQFKRKIHSLVKRMSTPQGQQ